MASCTENTTAHSLQRILAVGRSANLSSVMRYLVSHLGQWNLITFTQCEARGGPCAHTDHQSSRCKWLRIASRVLSSGAKAKARSHISVDLL